MPTNKKFVDKVEDEFTLEDIGSTLLEELAERLYQPQGVVREYIQNAVDAHRQWTNESGASPEGPVGIVVRPNGLSIMDYGIGLNLEEMKKVKSIAVSRKRSADIKLTGHKGVGIWAGLSFFQKMTMYSTAQGSDRGYELTIYFKQIKDAISDATSIGAVLNPNYHIHQYEDSPEEHYTNVELEGPIISREQFLDPEFLSDVVRRICPCEIDSTFVYAEKLVEWYQQQKIETFPIHVDNVPIYRSFPSDVVNFRTENITIDDKPFARCWLAVHNKGSVLKPQSDQLIGFNMIHSGFALGENLFSAESMIGGYENLNLSNYLRWYIGEVHVTHPELLPNLKRDDLEESELARQFRGQVRDFYRSAVYDARIHSKQIDLEKGYGAYEKMIGVFSDKKVSGLSSDDVRQIRNIEQILIGSDQQVAKYKSKSATDRDTDIVALKNTKSYRKRVQTKIKTLLDGIPQEEEAIKEDKSGLPPSAGINDTGSADGLGDAQDKPTKPTTTGKKGQPNSSSQVAENQSDATSKGQTELNFSGNYIAVEVVLVFVEDILLQLLPNDVNRKEELLIALKQRISTVTTNA